MGENRNRSHNGKRNQGKNYRNNVSKVVDSSVEDELKAAKEAERKALEAEYEGLFETTDVDKESEISTVVDDEIDEKDDIGTINDIPVREKKDVKKPAPRDDEEIEFIRERFDEKPDFVVTWPTHDSEKDLLSIDFHRGSHLRAENYVQGSRCLIHGRCKLDTNDWLKDFENVKFPADLQVAEVRFKNDRKDFFAYPTEMSLVEGEVVAVETASGHDIGIVTLVGPIAAKQRERKKNTLPVDQLKKIYRRARPADVEKFLEAVQLEHSTLYRSREIACNLNLEMKLNDIEYQGDNTKAIFYYTADGRVDFRELIKRLAEEFHVRIEMRQIGFRQESAKLGGVGSCGRELCCASWINEFQTIKTDAARVQQLTLNPQKLQGQCGKLKCCLSYELESYTDALKQFPDHHIILKTKKGDARNVKNEVFKGLMWYSYLSERSSMLAIPVEKVREIIDMNNKDQYPEQLEDYAFTYSENNSEVTESEARSIKNLQG